MWRTILVYALKAAVASGLPHKGVVWLKSKLRAHLLNLERRINRDLDDVEKVAGEVYLYDNDGLDVE